MAKEQNPEPKNGARFPSAFSLARNRAVKKVALWVGGVSLATFSVVLLFGGLIGGHHGFTTRIDRGSTLEHVTLSARNKGVEKDEQGVYFLKAEGLSNAKPTTAQEVYDKLCRPLFDQQDIGGEHILNVENGEGQRAFAYTFYLENTSQEKDQNYTFYISLDSYSAPNNNGAKNPYSYLRVGVFRNVEGDGKHDHVWYGALSDQGTGTAEDPNDRREAIAGIPESNPRVATFTDPLSNQRWCEAFGSTKELVREDATIHKGETIRYTIVTYFEGTDFDCAGSYPEGAGVSLSAHFGN